MPSIRKGESGAATRNGKLGWTVPVSGSNISRTISADSTGGMDSVDELALGASNSSTPSGTPRKPGERRGSSSARTPSKQRSSSPTGSLKARQTKPARATSATRTTKGGHAASDLSSDYAEAEAVLGMRVHIAKDILDIFAETYPEAFAEARKAIESVDGEAAAVSPTRNGPGDPGPKEQLLALRDRQHEMSEADYEAERKRILDSL